MHRLSDGEGNVFVEDVPCRDRKGRRRVLLQWGPEVDVVIPQQEEDGEEAGPSNKGGFRSWVGTWLEGVKTARRQWKEEEERLERLAREDPLRYRMATIFETYP